MGLLDLPAPFYAAVDGALAPLVPPLGRFVLWGVLGGVISMLIYHLASPQAKLSAAKGQAADARRRLWAEDDFARAAPLIRAQLGAATRRLGLALPASLAALLPVLTLAVWLDTAYGYALPAEGETRAVTVAPERFTGSLTTQGGVTRLRVEGAEGVVAERILDVPVPHVGKRRWWNLLIDNPAGYLPPEGPVESVTMDLPPQEFHALGPPLARSWLVAFFPALLVASLLCHRVLRTA